MSVRPISFQSSTSHSEAFEHKVKRIGDAIIASYQLKTVLPELLNLNETERCELLKACLRTYKTSLDMTLLQGIEDFQFQDRSKVIEIFEESIRHEGAGTVIVSLMCRLPPLAEQEKCEIARYCAEKSPDHILDYLDEHSFNRLGFSDEVFRLEILRICAKTNPQRILENHQKFQISDETFLVQVIKLYLQTPDTYLIPFILRSLLDSRGGDSHLDFHLKNMKERNRVEILSACIKKLTTRNINLWTVLRRLPDFGIKEESNRIDLLLLFLEQVPEVVANHIHNFQISDKKRLKEIVIEQFLKKCPKTVPAYIQNFGFDEPTRIEILQLCPADALQCIADFEISSEDEMVAALHRCLEKEECFWVFGSVIQNCGISTESKRIELLRNYLKQAPTNVPEHIHNFAISDEPTRVEFLQECSRLAPLQTAWNAQNFAISNPAIRFASALECCSRCRSSMRNLANFDLTIDQIKELFLTVLPKQDVRVVLDGFRDYMKESSWKNCIEIGENFLRLVMREKESEWLEKRLDAILKINHPHVQSQHFACLTEILRQCYTRLTQEEVGFIEQYKLLDAIFAYQVPEMRLPLAQKALQMIRESRLETYKKRSSSPHRDGRLEAYKRISSSTHIGWKDKLREIRPILTLICSLQEAGLPLEGFEEIEKAELKDIRTIQALVRLLLDFSKMDSRHLSLENKRGVLARISAEATLTNSRTIRERKDGKIVSKTVVYKKISDQSLKKVIRSLQFIMDFEEYRMLEGEVKSLEITAKSALEKHLPLEGEVKDPVKKYQDTFGKCRNPEAIMQYIGAMRTLGKPAIMDCLARFITSVLNTQESPQEGVLRFPNIRYSLENSPHLQCINGFDPTLLEKWQQGVKIPLHELTTEEEASKVRSQNLAGWIKIKILDDKHLGDPAQFPLIQEYFATDVEQRVRLLSQGCDGSDPRSALQGLCLQLAEALEKERQVELLTQIQQVLQDPSLKKTSSEFLNDVIGLLGIFRRVAGSQLKGFTATLTDDWTDLLLCGTEMADSCQRTDGLPEVNKGLLGYLMHGHVLLIAIKNDVTEKMESRALLKLLWDGKQPVILLERYYPLPPILNPAHQIAIEKLAIAHAEKLGLPLVQIGCDSSSGKTCDGCVGETGYPCDISSGKGSAPFEYSDATFDVAPQGEYTARARHLKILYAPAPA